MESRKDVTWFAVCLIVNHRRPPTFISSEIYERQPLFGHRLRNLEVLITAKLIRVNLLGTERAGSNVGLCGFPLPMEYWCRVLFTRMYCWCQIFSNHYNSCHIIIIDRNKTSGIINHQCCHYHSFILIIIYIMIIFKNTNSSAAIVITNTRFISSFLLTFSFQPHNY